MPFLEVFALFRIWTAREVLNAPQVQNFAMNLAHRSGVTRPSLTLSIIFFARLLETSPWPHMVVKASTYRSGRRCRFPLSPNA